VIEELTRALETEIVARAGRPDYSAWTRQLDEWRHRFPYRYTQPDDGLLKPPSLTSRISEATGGNGIYVSGVGQHQMWASQFIRFRRPRTWVNSGGLGAMGFGVPAAMGAKVAMPGDEVWCIDGDGCFQMTCQELATAVLEDLPIVVVIVNNGYLGMVQQWQNMFFDDRLSHVHLTHQVPNYAMLAEAYGAAGFTVSTEDELEPVLAEALALGRTAVVDCRVDPREQCFPMIPAGAAALELIEFEEPEGVVG